MSSTISKGVTVFEIGQLLPSESASDPTWHQRTETKKVSALFSSKSHNLKEGIVPVMELKARDFDVETLLRGRSLDTEMELPSSFVRCALALV